MKIFLMFLVGLVLASSACAPLSAQPLERTKVPTGSGARVAMKYADSRSNDAVSTLQGWKSVGDLTLPYFIDSTRRVAFSPDGKYIAAAGVGIRNDDKSPSGVIFLWNARTRVLVERLETPEAKTPTFEDLIWSPDSRKIAAWPNPSGSPQALYVWDVASSAILFSVKDPELTVTSACFTRDDKLLVTWGNNLTPTLNEGRVTIEDGETTKEVKLEKRSVMRFVLLKDNSILALVFNIVGENEAVLGEPIVKTSLCNWQNGQLSPPLIEFNEREAFFTLELSRDERFAVLTGIEQESAQTGPIPLAVACDLKTPKVLWHAPLKDVDVLAPPSISPDGKAFWAQGAPFSNQPCFDLRTGALINPKSGVFPIFSLDEKRAVRGIYENRGVKNNLRTFEVFEKQRSLIAAH